MSALIKALNPVLSKYKDRKFEGTEQEYQERLKTSTTLYIGNLSFFTTEEQLHELFSRVGAIDRIIMGLDRNRNTPCGFCFVLYYTREEAEGAVKYLNQAVLDGRPIRVDFDWGFAEGRQYGRGRTGGQVRDDVRTNFDAARGGYGKMFGQEMAGEGAVAGQKRGREGGPMEFVPKGKHPRAQGDRGVEDDPYYVRKA